MFLRLGIIAFLTGGALYAAELPFIECDPATRTAFRESGTNKPFVMVGLNYFDPETGWAPKLWQKFDETRVRAHLELIHQQGFNTIRVFLTYDSFHRQPGEVYAEGEAKFRKLLELCRERKIYLIPTGPAGWEGLPDWHKGNLFADEAILQADETWWGKFAARFQDEPAIAAWDLMNEPMVGWDGPAMKTRWNGWLAQKYQTVDKLAAAWHRPVSALGELDQIAVPPKEPAPNDQRLFDYQCFREQVGDEWTRRHTAAIRAVDKRHLITIGHIQWAAPVYLPTVWHYAGFDLQQNVRHLDFMTIHFYPIKPPRACDGPEGMANNAAYLEALLYLSTTDKPLVIGEFGWYGGGELRVGGKLQLPDRPMEHQVQWCARLLALSRGRAAGWLNWAFADTPTSTDLTRWSGLWTQQLELKPWGRQFSQFAREMTANPAATQPFPEQLTAQPFDRRSLLTALRAASRPSG